MASHVEVSNPRILAGRPLQPSKPTPNTMPETVPDSQYSEFGNKMRTFINSFLRTRKKHFLGQQNYRGHTASRPARLPVRYSLFNRSRR
jgi:hypothetical protein